MPIAKWYTKQQRNAQIYVRTPFFPFFSCPFHSSPLGQAHVRPGSNKAFFFFPPPFFISLSNFQLTKYDRAIRNTHTHTHTYTSTFRKLAMRSLQRTKRSAGPKKKKSSTTESPTYALLSPLSSRGGADVDVRPVLPDSYKRAFGVLFLSLFFSIIM